MEDINLYQLCIMIKINKRVQKLFISLIKRSENGITLRPCSDL